MRLSYDDADFEDEQAFFEGKPFTGVLFEEFPSGLLCSETFYVDGLRQGPERIWHESGLLAEEVFYWRNRWHGTSRAWLVDGTMIQDCVYLYGLCVVERRWSHSGQLKTDWRASPDAPAVVATVAIHKSDVDGPPIEW